MSVLDLISAAAERAGRRRRINGEVWWIFIVNGGFYRRTSDTPGFRAGYSVLKKRSVP